MQLTVQNKKLYTNLGIGLLAGGVVITGGGVGIGYSSLPVETRLPLLYTGISVGSSAIVAGSVLLGLGLAAKVKK